MTILLAAFLLGAPARAAAADFVKVSFASRASDDEPADFVQAVGRQRHFLHEAGVEFVEAAAPRGRRATDADVVLLGRLALDQENARKPGRYRAFLYAAQDAAHPLDAVVVSSSTRARGLADFRQLKVLGYPREMSAVAPILRELLAENGFPSGSVELRPLDERALWHGPWDALYLRETRLSSWVAMGKVKVLVPGPLMSARVVTPYPVAAYAFSDDFLSKNPDAAARVAAAFDRTLDFIRSNPAEARRLYAAWKSHHGGKAAADDRPMAYAYLRSDEIPLAALQSQSDRFARDGLVPSRVDAGTLRFQRRPATPAP